MVNVQPEAPATDTVEMAPFRLKLPVLPDMLITWTAAVEPPVAPVVLIPPLAFTVPVVMTIVAIREVVVEVLGIV